MPASPRPNNLGIIYAASGPPLGTYVDVKGVTQNYIALGSAYTEMTTIMTGGVDTSKPFVDLSIALTLSCQFHFDVVTSYAIKLQYRRYDEVDDSSAWKDLQTVSQNDTSTTSAEHVIAAPDIRLALQTASEFTAGQIRILVKYLNEGTPTASDYVIVKGMVG